jgi:hypothetical protein
MAADGRPSHSEASARSTKANMTSNGDAWTWTAYDERHNGLRDGVPMLRAEKCDFWDDHFLDK